MCKGTYDLDKSIFSTVTVMGADESGLRREREMRRQHQGIYCEQNERKHRGVCEGFRWDHKLIPIGGNLWQRGSSSKKRKEVLGTELCRSQMGSTSLIEELASGRRKKSPMH